MYIYCIFNKIKKIIYLQLVFFAVVVFALIFSPWVGFTVLATPGIYETINFQSKIVNSDGTNFSGACGNSCDFRFSLWDSASGGIELWSENYAGLNIQNGLVHVKLGSQTAFDSSIFLDDSLYLEVAINADGLNADFEEVFNAPRLRLSAVAYAFNSKYLDGKSSSDFVALAPDSAQLTGDVDSSLIHLDLNSVNNPNFVQFKRNGSDVFVIDHNGNVTIQPTVSSTALQVQGNVSVSGTTQFGDNVDFQNNQAQNFRLENLGSSPVCDMNSLGRQYYNTSTTKGYICVESAVGVYSWVDFTDSGISSLPTPLAGLQARRTTNFSLTALNTWYDIPLDITDVENQPSVIEHNATNTERIDIKEDGLYQISYHLTSNDAGVTHQIESRVQVNNTTVLNGSYLVNRNYQNEYGPTSTTFIANLSQNDYITLQAQRNTTNTVINETMLMIIKLDSTGGGGVVADQDLDSVYAQDPDKMLIVDNTAGLIFRSDTSGDIAFDLRSTGGFALQTNSSDMLRMASDGSLTISSDTTFLSNVDFSNNEALRFRLENLDLAPICNLSYLGRQYYNTLLGRAFVCIESEIGVYTWFDFTSLTSSSNLSKLATVQARRTSDFTLTALSTWYDVPLDTTDIETVPDVLEHNLINTERIDIKQDGIYQITYHINANDTGTTHQLESRVRRNNITVLNGSYLSNQNYQNEFAPTTAIFVAELAQGDFISLQAMRTTANTIIGETLLTIIKLDGYVLDASSLDLDSAYQNDPDKILNVDSSNGLTFNSTSSGDIAFNLQSTGGFTLQDNTSTALRISNTGDFEYTLNATDNSSFTINNLGTGMIRFNDEVTDTSPVVIDGNGNFGVGTDSPSEKLHVAGGARITDLASCDIVYTDADGNLQCGQDLGAAWDGYDNAGGQTFTTTPITINIDTERKTSSNYFLNTDEVTIQSEGVYQISFSCSLDNPSSNARTIGRCWLELDAGSGFSMIDGTDCYTYNRQNTQGENSCSRTIISSIDQSDKIRVRAVRHNGTATLTTIADGSSLAIQKIISSGADLAEIYYTNDEALEAGDIVSVDSSIYAGVAKTQVSFDSKVLGIISTQPAKVIGNENIQTDARPVLVALAGRVPVRVSLDSEPILAGDYITSKENGVGQKATKPGYVVGKALEDWNPESGKQTVLVFVDLGYFDPQDGKIYKDMIPGISHEDGGINIGSVEDPFNQIYAQNIFAKDKFSVSSNNLAEVYKTFDRDIQAGDIVGFDYSSDLSIKKNSQKYDSNIIGVVSADAGIALSDWILKTEEEQDFVYKPVALVGRVPVKVTDENGPIQKGDRLVASSTAGYAMKACGPKYCNSAISIGIALEDFDYSASGDSLEVEKSLEEQGRKISDQLDEIKQNTVLDMKDEIILQIDDVLPSIDQVEKEVGKLVQIIDDEQGKGRVMMFVNLSYYQATSKPENTITPMYIHQTINSDSLQGNIFGSLEVEDLVVRGDARILGNIIVQGRLKLSTQNADRVILESGHTSVRVLFQEKWDRIPIITITPVGEYVQYMLDDITSEGFTIKIQQKIEKDIWFNWHAFESGFDNEIFTKENKSEDEYETVDMTENDFEDIESENPSGNNLYLDQKDVEASSTDNISINELEDDSLQLAQDENLIENLVIEEVELVNDPDSLEIEDVNLEQNSDF